MFQKRRSRFGLIPLIILTLLVSNFILVYIFLGFYQRYLLLIPYGLFVLGMIFLLAKLDFIASESTEKVDLVNFAKNHVSIVVFALIHLVIQMARTINLGFVRSSWLPEIMLIIFIPFVIAVFYLRKKHVQIFTLMTRMIAILLGYLTVVVSFIVFLTSN